MKKLETSIEDIILTNDKRGISALQRHLPKHFCGAAAECILQNPGTILITTGFYILNSDAPETDGPNGALAIGDALHTIGLPVIYVTGKPLSNILSAYLGDKAPVIEFPLLREHEENTRITEKIVATHKPTLLISVERCSATASGKHLNIQKSDITEKTPKIEYLFKKNIPSIGIGDGGNEIGMGNLAKYIKKDERLPSEPAAITCNHLIIASVSNWGAYGLVAALSLIKKQNLLLKPNKEKGRLKYLVDAGMVDGTTGKQEYSVDGFTLAENMSMLQRVHTFIDSNLS